MKRFLKILKWFALTVVAVVVLFIIYAMVRPESTFEASYPEITASND